MEYKLRSVIRMHSGWINSVDIDPFGMLLASSSMDGTVKMTDMATKQLLATIPQQNVCEDIKFSTLRPYVFCAMMGGLVRCYDLVDRVFIGEYYGHRSSVLCLDTHGDRLISGAADCTVKLWDVRTEKCVKSVETYSAPVNDVVFHNGVVYSCAMDGSVSAWDERNDRTTIIAQLESNATSMCVCKDIILVLTKKSVFKCIKPGNVEMVLNTENALSLERYDERHYLIGKNGCIHLKSTEESGGESCCFRITGSANHMRMSNDMQRIVCGGVDKNIELLEYYTERK